MRMEEWEKEEAKAIAKIGGKSEHTTIPSDNENTIIRVTKETAKLIKEFRITDSESYEEIIKRKFKKSESKKK